MNLERISIWTYTAKGKRLFRVEVRPLPNSKQRKVQRGRFATKEQAIRAALTLRDALDGDIRTNSKLTIKELCGEFIEFKRGTISENSLAHYEQIFRLYVIPFIGTRSVAEITPGAIEDMHRQLATEYRQSTLDTVKAKLETLFNFAMLERRCLLNNPASLARNIRSTAGLPSMVQKPWTCEETVAALRAFEGTHLAAFVNLAVFLGLRKGEAFALKWSDVDLQNRSLVISSGRSPRRQIDSDGNIRTHEVVGPTKGGRFRTYQLPERLVHVLNREFARQTDLAQRLAERWLDSGHVVCSPLGGPASISRTARDFREILRSSGIRHIRIHDLRHTSAVLSMIGGSALEATSQSLGHSSSDFTKRTYAPYVPTFSKQFVEGITEALSPHL